MVRCYRWVPLASRVAENVKWRGNAEEKRKRREKNGFTSKDVSLRSAAVSSCLLNSHLFTTVGGGVHAPPGPIGTTPLLLIPLNSYTIHYDREKT